MTAPGQSSGAEGQWGFAARRYKERSQPERQKERTAAFLSDGSGGNDDHPGNRVLKVWRSSANIRSV